MLGAMQAVLLGAAGFPPAGYAAIVTGIPDLLAYWRCSDAGTLVDGTAGDRDGSFTGTVTLTSGIPAESDQALVFDGTASAAVANDAGLQVSAGTVSAWFRADAHPDSGRAVILSKDQSGFVDGDWSLTLDEDGNLDCHFQTTAGAQPIVSAQTALSAGTDYHVVITFDGSGFEMWLDGRHTDTNASWTGGWATNTQPFRFATAPWTATLFQGVIDEVAIYSRVLDDAEIVALAQRSGIAPIATADSFAVTEETTGILDVVGNDQWVGRRSGLTVEIVADGAFGDATPRSDKSVDFAADSVAGNEADSFTYRITDATGLTSNTATVDVLVQDAADAGGGTLVYSWAPRADWIDGISLSGRDANDVLNINKWDESGTSGATVGGELVINSFKTGGGQRICFNYCPRAPSGTKAGQDIPCLEVACPESESTQSNVSIGIPLYDGLDGNGPRHMRIVMEVKTSKASDNTFWKSNGRTEIPTGDPYRDYRDSHEAWTTGKTATSQKYFIGVWGGATPAGGLRENHWENPDERIDTYSDRWAPGASGATPIVYSYGFNRESNAGGWISSLLTPSSPQKEDGTTARVTDSGVHGVWHRIETEVRLCTPSLAQAADARRKSSPTNRPAGGDGFVKHYWTRDIDNELGGGVGPRTLLITGHTMIQNCWRDDVGSLDNMHTLVNLAGPWIYQAYGGQVPCQRDAFGWIRKIEVYRHD